MYRIESLAGGRTRITHRVGIDGPAAETLGAHVTAGIPATIAALAAQTRTVTARP